jgi:hypothetical protein
MHYDTVRDSSFTLGLIVFCFWLFGGMTAQVQAQNLITAAPNESGPDCVLGDSIVDSWNTTKIFCGKPNIPGQPVQDPGTNTVPGEGSGGTNDDPNGYFFASEETDITMFQTITGLSSGATYRFETYAANVASGSPDFLVVTLQWQDGTGADVGAPVPLAEVSPPDNNWVQVEETGIVAPSGISQAVLSVTFDDRGGVAFADVFTDEFFFEETAPAPVNEDPLFADGPVTSLTVDEDAAATSLSAQIEVDDTDTGQTLTWSVAGGPSNGVLSGFPATASSGTGVQPSGVTYDPDADFAGSDSFEIQVDDGNGGSDNITVNVTVNNLAPVFSSSTTASFAENGTGTVLDNDATNGGDGTSDSGVTYSIGGTDAGAFSIDGSTGALAFNTAPDFENPADADSNNEYVVDVTADDGEASNNTATQTVTITVTDVTADLALVDGSSAGLDFSATVNRGTANNAVGIFEISASLDEAVVNAISIANNNPGVPGISSARLFASTDASLDVGTDAEIGSIAIDNASAPTTFDFTGLSTEITSSATFLIFAIDVDADAPDDEVLFSLADPSALTIPDGAIATINGQSQTSFTALPLSNASTALPVELVTFEATPENGNVQLRWVTVTETSNAGFDVQRRLSDSGWSTLTRVAGAGTTTESRSYRFTDDTLPYEAASIEYRLRQVDVGGKVSVTEPVSVDLTTTDQLELLGTYPNPTQTRAAVRFAVPDDVEDARLVLFDLLGRQVRSLAVTGSGRQKTTLDTDGLATGTYFLRLTAGGHVRTTKLTVVR